MEKLEKKKQGTLGMKANHIHHDRDKKGESITFSTILCVDGHYIRLQYTRLLGYLDMSKLDEWEFGDFFLHSLEAFTNPKLNHAMYKQITASGYEQPGKWHELRWDEIKISRDKANRNVLYLTGQGRTHIMAIPPSSTPRLDYITADGRYHYDCKPDEYRGIPILQPFIIK